ncbi:protein of unknown function DUF1376 [Vibrio phage 1.003.O._10N.286.48.A2]|nr:protein of unknown function DUF1376 [Vibrio phage 1.003.O._10N.286.48.A2]
MHYYQFNIGDYASSTQHLDDMEDLAYRRMLDLYYQKELPLPEDVKQIARLIRMRTHCECIESVLQEFFELTKDGYINAGADKVLGRAYSKSESARLAAQARWDKKRKEKQEVNTDAMQTHSESNADAMPPNTHNPLPKTQIKDLFDAKRIIPIWNSLGCAKHKGLTKSAEKALEKTYKEYKKSSDEPKELNDWLEAYLKKGFKNWMTDHHRDLDNGQWCADLEFAVRFSTYDKIKNTVKK